MSSNRLLWVGHSSEEAQTCRKALEIALEKLSVEIVGDGREALNILAKNPRNYFVVIVDALAAHMDVNTLATGIKQINPAIEIIVLGQPGEAWRDLTLPRYFRPILLKLPCGPDEMISCVAKLQEMVEAKEDYEQLSRGLGDNIGMSRTSTEAVLTLLTRQNSLGTISMRRDGFFTSYNAEAERLTGYALDEVAHIQVWTQTVLPDYDSVRMFLDSIAMFWARKIGRENMRLMIRRKDGRILTLSMTAVVLLDNFGHARQIVLMFFDPLGTGTAREYELLCDSGACAVYTYLPEEGFIKVSAGALDLMNQAFSLDLTAQDVEDKRVEELPVPSPTARMWQSFLEAAAAGSVAPGQNLPPIGLPGRHILEHTFVERVATGAGDKHAVLALVAPRNDLRYDSLENLSTEMLAQKTLNALPRPFVLLRAVRNDKGDVKDFTCIGMNHAGIQAMGLQGIYTGEMSFAGIFRDASAAKMLFEAVREVSETGQHKDFEMPMHLTPHAGEPALVRFWLGKVGDGAAVFFDDVTAIRKEEHHLRQYRHIFSHMDEAIIVTDLEGNVIDWNPASERMFGYAKEQILGRSVYMLTQNPDGAQLKQQSGGLLRDGDIWKGEYEFMRADGTRGVAACEYALLKDDQGMEYGTVGLSHDVTERKRLEERLTIKSQELQEKNLALNTLLRHAQEERVMACENVAADLARKVNDRLSRILEGKQKPKTVETQVKLLLEELGGVPQSRGLDRNDPALKLSEKELEVAQLIRLGKTSEEIAFILDKSPDTIRLQRISIRKKLGLTKRDRNLAAFLKKMDL